MADILSFAEIENRYGRIVNYDYEDAQIIAILIEELARHDSDAIRALANNAEADEILAYAFDEDVAFMMIRLFEDYFKLLTEG